MKKRYLILALIVLLISGCGGGGRKAPITSLDVYTGTDGITAKFFNVQDDVFEQNIFRVNMELENKGAYPNEDELTDFNGYLALGLEDDYMEVKDGISGWEKDMWIDGELEPIDEKRARFELKGKTMENPLGGMGKISVDVQAKAIRENQSEKHDTDVLMSVCYRYQTKAVPTVCIDAAQYSFKEMEKSCVVKDINLNSQGAPVAVTKVESEMQPYGKDGVKPMFLIYLENKGNGVVVNVKKYDDVSKAITDNDEAVNKACSSKPLEHDELNYLFVTAKLKLGDGEHKLKCSPRSGLVRLKDKKGMVRCLLEDDDGSALLNEEKGTYTTPLQIILDYGYTFTISKKVTVKKVLEY